MFIAKILPITICALLCSANLSSQTACATLADPNAVGAIAGGGVGTQCAYYIKIYVHLVRDDQGLNGFPIANVVPALGFLDVAFNPHDIYFIWDGDIDLIDDTDVWGNNPENAFAVNAHTDGIDIYLFDDANLGIPGQDGIGLAANIPSTAFFIIGETFCAPHIPLALTMAMAHEMGHCLSLFHTYHSLELAAGGNCEEHVDRDNCLTCGDYICDTPTDICNDILQINCNTCQWLVQGAVDSEGHLIVPDFQNIMSAAPPACMEYFTEGQSNRMKFFIENSLVLQPCQAVAPAITTISTNTTWSEYSKLVKDVVVEPGATLTISPGTRVFFYGAANTLTIKPGGTLIVDGATLTSGCYWRGIDVWGNSLLSQYIPGNQGKAIFQNGAVVEHAIDGVSTWDGVNGNFSTTGGIVMASNTTFRNNWRDVEMMSYHNFLGAQPKDNLSQFTECSFLTDGDYRAQHFGNYFPYHATLWDVEGIKFLGCNFETDQINYPFLGTDGGNGIYALDASFSVLPHCPGPGGYPCAAPVYSSFKNLFYGVYASSSGNVNKNFVVDETLFDNVVVSATAIEVNNAQITRNTFDLEGNDRGFMNIGVYMKGCTGYHIEDNLFELSQTPPAAYPPLSLGTYINNSGDEHNEVFHNTYIGVDLANLAENDNDGGSDGLQYFCNTNAANGKDFAVVDWDQMSDGITQTQAQGNKPAGNTFSLMPPQLPTGDESDFLNHGFTPVKYFYYNHPLYPEQNPIDITPNNQVVKVPLTQFNSCDSRFEDGDKRLSEAERQMAQNNYIAEHSAWSSLSTLLQNLKDGGNTQALQTEVQTAYSGETWALRNSLLEKSPYLTEEVLKAAADRTDVLPEPILLEILTANPDELSKTSLMEYLENKANPLPEYMMDVLRLAAQGQSARTALEMEITRHHAEMQLAAGALLLDMTLNDSIYNPSDYRAWLSAKQSLPADYAVVESYMAEGNSAAALVWCEAIPLLHPLNADENSQYQNYRLWLQLQINQLAMGNTLLQLDSTQVEIVRNWADTDEGIAGEKARNLLNFAYGGDYFYWPIIPEGNNNAQRVAPMPLVTPETGAALGVYPNPSEEWAVISYRLPKGVKEADVRAVSPSGNSEYHYHVNNTVGQLLWDTRGVPAGIYALHLTWLGGTQTVKLIVQH